MKTVKEYLAKMGKMPTIQYRFKCPMCGLNSNANKLTKAYKPKLMMRAYLGRGGIQFFEPERFPEAIKQDFEKWMVIKCKAILKYFNEPVYTTKNNYFISSLSSYSPKSSVHTYEQPTTMGFGVKTGVKYGD